MVDIERIKTEYELEQAGNRKAVAPEDIPISYEAITHEWLTHILCKDHPGAQIVSCDLDKTDDGLTNRRRLFLKYNDVGRRLGLPASVFCKSSQKLDNRLIMARCGHIVGEVSFYNQYAAKLDIEKPECYLATYNEKSYNSIIMLQDLVTSRAQFCNYQVPMTRERAESQMVLLGKLHGTFYDNAELNNPNLMTFEETFATKDELLDMKKSCEIGIDAAQDFIPKALYARRSEIWPAVEKSIAMHKQYPRTLTHGDPHFANWYISGNGSMALCDWQCIAKGHWGRDVAYAMSSSLSIENRRAWERDLIKFYLEVLHQSGGPSVSFAEAWEIYRQHLMAALQVWILTLAFALNKSLDAPDFHSDEQIQEFVTRIATAVDDLNSLDAFK